MIKIEKIKVYNMADALRGLRNPLNSWQQSDTYIDSETNQVIIGKKDLRLAQRMIRSGADESKFMRQIFVSFDLTAPLYFWKEFDTYKIGTVSNSCSTMHTLAREPITIENFSFDEEEPLAGLETNEYLKCRDIKLNIIKECEWLRQKFIDTRDKRYWRLLIQTLPNAWNQMRTITLNYQVLRAQYFARRYHKLIEWRQYCDFIKTLPYGEALICCEKEY